MTALELPQGGGVMFVQHEGSVEMMSDERFIDRFGLEAGQDDAGQR